MKKPLATYVKRPPVAARKPNDMIGDDGLVINDGIPHEELIASTASVIPLQDQVDSLMRLGRIHRTNALRHFAALSDDDYGDYLDEDDEIGLTPFELDGLKPFSLPEERHEAPPEKPEPIQPSAPKAGEGE